MRSLLFASVIVVISSLRITPCENDRLKKICGKTNRGSSFKSFGGRRVRKNEFPWLTSFTANGKLCSGALISQRHVITAAHCVAKVYHVNETEHCAREKPGRLLRVDVGNLKKYSVRVGSGCSHPRKCHKPRGVAKVTPHPLYKMHCEKRKDIAIIEFNRDVSESEATPICVANSATEVQKVLQAAGQGVDPTLQGDKLAKGLQVITLGFEYLVKNEGDLATRNATAGSAPGDSGGPLFQFNEDGRAVLLGPCSRKVYYYRENVTRDFFSDIREETKWICSETGVCPDSRKLSAEELQKCKM